MLIFFDAKPAMGIRPLLLAVSLRSLITSTHLQLISE
jgi:hypothetical protein